MNLNFFTKAFLILALLIISSINLNAQKPTQILNNAIKLIELEKFETARSVLDGLENTSESSNAYFYKGLSYISNLNFDDLNISLQDAKNSFTKGIAANDKNALNYVGLGILSLQNDNSTEAESYFNQAIKIDNNFLTNLYIGKAYTYTSHNDLEKAIKYLTIAAKKNRKSADVHVTLGDAYLKKQDPNNSILEYKKAEDLNPSYFPTYLKQSNIYKYAHNYSAALSPLNYVISRDTNYLPAYRYLAELYAASNQKDKALEVYKNQYMPKTDGSCNDNILYAKFLFEASKYKESADLLKSLQQKCNLKPVFDRLLAYSSYHIGDYKTADEAITKFIDLSKREQLLVSDYVYKSNIALALGNTEEAKKYQNKAIEKGNKDPLVISSMAKEAFNFKNYKNALDLYTQIDDNKLNVQDLYYIGVASYLTQDFKKSESAFNTIVQKQPNYITAWTYLGYIKSREEAKKFTGAAKPFFEKVIELGSQNPKQYKDDLVNAYQYMGQYELEINKSPNGVRSYMQKILSVDPTNKQAQKALNALDKAAEQVKQSNKNRAHQ